MPRGGFHFLVVGARCGSHPAYHQGRLHHGPRSIGAVHTAATIENFVAMECHAVDFISWWSELVAGATQPIIKDGYITVPDTPGLGVELNEAVVKEHLRYPGYFEPNAVWDPTRITQ